MSAELGEIVVSDLQYLQRSLKRDEFLHEDDLRRDSAVLRKLLVDNGNGLLADYWTSLGNRRQIRVTGVDMKKQLEGLDLSLVSFASAGGATNNGTMVQGALEYQAVMSEEMIKKRSERGSCERETVLTTFMDATSIRVAGVGVTRRNVIQFVANRLGGVHFDPTRTHEKEHVAKQFEALDHAVGVSITDKRPVYFELLSIGQAILDSPQVASLLDT